MMDKHFKTIGIIGGIGSEATLDLYRWIIKLTPAARDQDHIPTLIYSLPQIPDRTQALLYGGDDPLPLMIHTGQTLEKAGADFILIPCNTAHAYQMELQSHLSIPIISMIESTAQHVQETIGGGPIGLLATTGTVRTEIYGSVFRTAGIELVLPTTEDQEALVMEAVYGACGVKAGYTTGRSTELLLEAGQKLIDRGARALIMGCTEIPLALDQQTLNVPLINPTQILAQAAVDAARVSVHA